MTQSLRKIFDLGVAALVAIIIMNFTASSMGFGIAKQDIEPTTTLSVAQTATFEVAALSQ